MKITPLLFIFFSLFIFTLSGEDEDKNPPIKITHSRVAVITDARVEDPSYYTDLRRLIYEKWNLRIIRGIYRLTSFKLDSTTSSTFSISIAFLLTTGLFIFIGFSSKKIKFSCYSGAFLCILGFIGSLYILSGIVVLNQFDYKAPKAVQKFYDAFIFQGLEFDVYDNWNTFTTNWDANAKEGILPYTIIAWTGMPYELENEKVNKWLTASKDLPLLHLCIGPHLPGKFHHTIFPSKKPTLDWDSDSGKSVCDKKTAYGRNANWMNNKDSSLITTANWHKNKVLYANGSIKTEKLNQVLSQQLNESSNLAWCKPILTDIVVLRMDDPGAAQNAYLESWNYPELSKEQWQGVATALNEAKAKMSIGYVSAWLDDGSKKLGDLYVNHNKIQNRIPGKAYPSSKVRYYKKSSRAWYECADQLNFLKNNPAFELELHGHTHITPDVQSWLSSSNKYSDSKWYREFLKAEVYPMEQRSVKEQKNIFVQSLKIFKEDSLPKPWAVVPPGHKISHNTSALAHEFQIPFMSDYSVTLSKANTGIFRCNLIKTKDSRLNDFQDSLNSKLPFILMVHDKDISNLGVNWFSEKLKELALHNKKIITLKELYFRLAIVPDIKYHHQSKKLILKFPLTERLKKSKEIMGKVFSFDLKLPFNTEVSKLPANIQLVKNKQKNGYVMNIAMDTSKPQYEIFLRNTL